jgi:hypothetical protein
VACKPLISLNSPFKTRKRVLNGECALKAYTTRANPWAFWRAYRIRDLFGTADTRATTLVEVKVSGTLNTRPRRASARKPTKTA